MSVDGELFNLSTTVAYTLLGDVTTIFALQMSKSYNFFSIMKIWTFLSSIL